MNDSERKLREVILVRDTGKCSSISLKFEGDRRYVETNVNIGLSTVCISWDEKDAFMDELAELIEKYQL